MTMQRRDFLKTIGAASTVAAIPGCATMSGASGKVMDVTDETSVRRGFDEIARAFGGVDVVVPIYK
jgi:NAD(P)-dependent dehydrogenase (short-subunit alcohol dehydrogenase family)